MNAAQLAVDSLARFGVHDAVRFEGKTRTNEEQELLACKLAAVLRARGVGPGDRVVVMMPNCPEIFCAFQAVWKIGAVILPVMPQLGPREVGYLLEDSGAKVALVAPVLAPVVDAARSAAPRCEALLSLGPAEVAGATDVTDEVAAAEPIDSLVDRAGDDLALLLYTSGTTGRPKGVMLTHDNILWSSEQIGGMAEMPEGMPILHVMPMAHSFGVLMMCVGFVKGFEATVMVRWDTRQVFENIERHRIERMGMVPTMLTYLLDFPERERFDIASLNWVWSGGAALANEVRVDFEREFDCTVRDGYGLTESTAVATAYSDSDGYRAGSCGRAVDGVEVAVMDDDHNRMPAGTPGEVCIRGRNVMKGYWGSAEATAEAVRDGWLHSGDIGVMDADGFLRITDRKKDLIIKGGENISPREIEEALYEHPAISEVAVVAVPHRKYGDDIWAAVVFKPGAAASEEELHAHTAGFVTRFKIPSRFVAQAELPKNAVGKIMKREVRASLLRDP